MGAMAASLSFRGATLKGKKDVCLSSDRRPSAHGTVTEPYGDQLAALVRDTVLATVLTSAAVALDPVAPTCTTAIAKCISDIDVKSH